MKVFLQIVCLAFPLAAVRGCKPLGGACDTFSRDCCGDRICSDDGFCEEPPSKLTKCKSDTECGGVRGSCFEGSCLSICRADSDCGEGSICVDGKSTLGGFCERNCSLASCSDTKRCCANNYCGFLTFSQGICKSTIGLTCLPQKAGVLPELPCCKGLVKMEGFCLSCQGKGESCGEQGPCCGKMLCGSNETCEDPK